MTKWTAGAVAIAAIAAASAASAEQLASRSEGTIVPVSRVLKLVESQNDFGDYQAMHYDRAIRSYEVLYADKDGRPKLMVVNAVTGKIER